jgi:hypothetical protein
MSGGKTEHYPRLPILNEEGEGSVSFECARHPTMVLSYHGKVLYSQNLTVRYILDFSQKIKWKRVLTYHENVLQPKFLFWCALSPCSRIHLLNHENALYTLWFGQYLSTT